MVIRLEDESMLAPLKRVIKSIAGIADVMVRKDVKTKAKGEVYARQLARVNELAALQNDWDDNGALPIEKKLSNPATLQSASATPSFHTSAIITRAQFKKKLQYELLDTTQR